MDDDPTIRLPRPPSRNPRPGLWLGGSAAAVLIAGFGVAAVLYLRPPPTAAPPALPLADEAQIRADRPTQLTAFRFAPNPAIVVLDFPGLRHQGLMFDRIAAFAEKRGEPHDRVLTDAQLDQAIRRGGDTVETYYYGHDYAAGMLREFFAVADRDHVALDPQEVWLRRFAAAQGMLAPGANQAVITLPREGADALVDESFRRTILHHELSHGEYFTVAAYADYVRRFWAATMDDADRATFERFLVAQDYDPAQRDLIVNEMQAYLMHTADPRAFSAAALGMAPAHLALLRQKFLQGMPAGWLRDGTTRPSAALATPAARPP